MGYKALLSIELSRNLDFQTQQMGIPDCCGYIALASLGANITLPDLLFSEIYKPQYWQITDYAITYGLIISPELIELKPHFLYEKLEQTMSELRYEQSQVVNNFRGWMIFAEPDDGDIGHIFALIPGDYMSKQFKREHGEHQFYAIHFHAKPFIEGFNRKDLAHSIQNFIGQDGLVTIAAIFSR